MSRSALVENAFSVRYLGREFRFRAQNALQQLYLRTEAAPLSARLLAFGTGPDEAFALACNCALLFQTLRGKDTLSSPDQALCLFSMGQVADLCALYWARVRTIQGCGGAEEGGWTEGGVCEDFETGVG